MTDTLTPPVPLIVSADPTPVEKAFTGEIIDDLDPLNFVEIQFPAPGGGIRLQYAWTRGGEPLGEEIDADARFRGLDAADFLAVTGSHVEEHTRGAVVYNVFDLQPIAAAVQAGERDDGTWRGKLQCLLDAAGHSSTRLPWWGVGPILVSHWANRTYPNRRTS